MPVRAIASLGSGHVDHCLEHVAVDQFFHRLTTGAGRVEDQTVEFVTERVSDGGYARGGNAEHRQADRRFVISRCNSVHDHAGDCVRGVRQCLAADTVQSGDVG